MKTLFLLAVLALVASTTFAQYSEVGGGYNEVGGGGGSQQCPQERPKLGSCKDYVMERCFTMKDFPVTWPTKWWKGGCEHEVREKCCKQLSQIAPQCRCDSIRGVIDLQLKNKEICHALHKKKCHDGCELFAALQKKGINGKIVCEFAIMAKYRVIFP